ncbi:MAG TPA: dihydropteroate synthase [Bacteroidales bacterium]|nr:dihydropteroate synthase [Bacteroidales bacterium]
MNLIHKKTFFSSPLSMQCNGALISFNKPLVMGILNLTPDSFYDGGKYETSVQIIDYVRKMLNDGADIIDIGAVTTKPNSIKISVAEEAQRLLEPLKIIRKEFPKALLSIDTFHSEIAKMAVDNGVNIINDISGGVFDKDMFKTVAQLKIPYILMHIQGTPQNMQNNPHYENVVSEIITYFNHKINQLRELDIQDIIIDPGFGFGKTVEHNFELLDKLSMFSIFNLPILVGVSRKSMICKVLGVNPDKALNGTTVIQTVALLKGANIIRVHDVKEAVESIKLLSNLQH